MLRDQSDQPEREFDARAIRDALVAALGGLHDEDGSVMSERARAEIAFHLCDWLDELEAWVRFCRDPSKFTPVEIVDLAFAFTIHAPAHLAAAAKILTGNPVRDVFGVGAVQEGR